MTSGGHCIFSFIHDFKDKNKRTVGSIISAKWSTLISDVNSHLNWLRIMVEIDWKVLGQSHYTQNAIPHVDFEFNKHVVVITCFTLIRKIHAQFRWQL